MNKYQICQNPFCSTEHNSKIKIGDQKVRVDKIATELNYFGLWCGRKCMETWLDFYAHRAVNLIGKKNERYSNPNNLDFWSLRRQTFQRQGNNVEIFRDPQLRYKMYSEMLKVLRPTENNA